MRPTNPRYTSEDIKYEAILCDDSNVQPAADTNADSDDDGVPQWEFNFIRFEDIYESSSGQVIDIVGVLQSSAILKTVYSNKIKRVSHYPYLSLPFSRSVILAQVDPY